MIEQEEVEKFLKELKQKVDIFDILVLDDRGKNAQTLNDLEITPSKRKEVIKELKPEDYYQGPLDEKMQGLLPMWVFGKTIKGHEVYIKISMGKPNSKAICISFHISEHPMDYPFKSKL